MPELTGLLAIESVALFLRTDLRTDISPKHWELAGWAGAGGKTRTSAVRSEESEV